LGQPVELIASPGCVLMIGSTGDHLEYWMER